MASFHMIVFVSTCVHKVAASNLISSASAILYVELCARWVLTLCLRLNIISSEESDKLYLINALSYECVCVSNCNYENNDETQVFATYSWHYFNFSMNTNQNGRTKLDTTSRNSNVRFIFSFELANKANQWKIHLAKCKSLTNRIDKYKEVGIFVDWNWKCFRLSVILYGKWWWLPKVISSSTQKMSTLRKIDYTFDQFWFQGHMHIYVYTGQSLLFIVVCVFFFLDAFVHLQQMGALFRLSRFQLTHCSYCYTIVCVEMERRFDVVNLNALITIRI